MSITEETFVSLVSDEEKRLFVREVAAQLAAASSVALNAETAAGLSEICQTIASKAEVVGAESVAHFMGECNGLCTSVLRGMNPFRMAAADETLKTAFAAVRSALFNMALGDSEDARGGQFDGIEAKICEIVSEPNYGVPEEKPPVAVQSQSSAAVVASESVAVTSAATVLSAAVSENSAERLMTSIARLADKTEMNQELREMTFEVASAARLAHSFRFSTMCGSVETDTPDALLDETHAKTVREQLLRWQRVGGDSSLMATLRQVGGCLWLELRQSSEAACVVPTTADICAPGVGALEDYRVPGGVWVRRAQLDLLLPTFKAYEVKFGGQTFLIPVSDVESILEVPPPDLNRIPFPFLLDLPEDWAPQTSARVCVVLRCRGKSYVVEVESVSGPQTYLARNVSDAGPNLRGVVGVARLPEGRRAPVVDVYPWIETYEERMIERAEISKTKIIEDDRYVVFRVGGRRYAVPFGAVKAVGRVESEFLVMGMVDTKKGPFHLRDMRQALGLEGEAGGMYIVLASASGSVGWIVDGLEPLLSISPAQMNERLRLAPFGYAHNGGRVQGLIRGVLPQSKTSIYLLDVDRLAPAGRPLRRFA
jgi:chemotaxis signal transduction protein